jgi:arylsulfate sulfotransferase
MLLCAPASRAIIIRFGTGLAKSATAPLAVRLTISTDVPSRVTVTVTNAAESWTRNFYDYTNNHSVLLYGFKPARTNYLTAVVRDRWGNAATNYDPLVLVTDPLPSDFPKLTLLTNQPELMEPGYTLFRLINQNTGKAYLTIVDQSGDVVWYSGRSSTSDIRQLNDGNLFIPLTASFVEFNLYGDTINTWNVPGGLSIDLHDGVPTDHGTILYLNDATRTVTNFPTSSTNPLAPHQTTNVMYNRVIEISSTNSSLLNAWSPINALDPTRIDYLTFTLANSLGVDCEHANAVIEDPRDGSIIVSMRHQDAVIKFSRSTGALKWILGPHENWGPQWQPYLLTPVGSPFEWQYGQHAPTFTPHGTLLLYDDGDYRASPFDASVPDASNYSRAVEYNINESTMEVSQVWDYGRTNGESIYTDRVGNADWLTNSGNVLITYGYVLYDQGVHPSATSPTATMLRIQEVTYGADPQVVFDLACFDYTNLAATYKGTAGYRSHRIHDLYSHLPQPVQDLVLDRDGDVVHLHFSADPARIYGLEASGDLINWTSIGTANDGGDGDFTFDYTPPDGDSAGFFRVVTQ